MTVCRLKSPYLYSPKDDVSINGRRPWSVDKDAVVADVKQAVVTVQISICQINSSSSVMAVMCAAKGRGRPMTLIRNEDGQEQLTKFTARKSSRSTVGRE